MSTIDIGYLAKMLVHGISQTQASMALGCTQGYVAQLMESSEELRTAMAEEESKVAAFRLKKDGKLQDIEKNLMRKAAGLIEDTDSLGEVVGALQKITAIRERQTISQPGGQGSGNLLELNLGKLAEAKLEVSMGDNRVIVHLGDTDMTRAPAKVVKEMVKDAAAKTTSEEDDWHLPVAQGI